MNPLRNRPTAIDVFSGAGGLSTGLEAAGFQVIGAIEHDLEAAKTFRRNHSGTIVWQRDIRRVGVPEVSRALHIAPGRLDLIAACPPCQGFSTMRTLNGGRRIVDAANDLLFQLVRFIRGFRPKLVMLENVPTLSRDRRLRQFQEKLELFGYVCRCEVIDAADFGVPQRRRRMIFIASRIGEPPVLTKSQSRKTVADAIRGLPKPGNSGDPLHDFPERRSEHVRDLIRHIPKNGGSRKDAPARFALSCHKKLDGFYDVYGRMAWNEPSPTITSGCHNPSKGRFLHPSQDRAITLREAALLQTFPRRYFFSLGRGKEHAALLIGNALPPRLISRVARPLIKLLQTTRLTRREARLWTTSQESSDRIA